MGKKTSQSAPNNIYLGNRPQVITARPNLPTLVSALPKNKGVHSICLLTLGWMDKSPGPPFHWVTGEAYYISSVLFTFIFIRDDDCQKFKDYCPGWVHWECVNFRVYKIFFIISFYFNPGQWIFQIIQGLVA